MRPNQRPQSFEQEYPEHEFAPLVDLGLKAASWAGTWRSVEPPRTEDATSRASQVGQVGSISPAIRNRRATLTTVTVIAAFALAAAFTHAHADCASADAADSHRAAPVAQKRASGLTRASESLRKAIEASESDGLDVYDDDLRPPAESLISLVNR